MLIEIPHMICIDKNPIVEQIRLNIQPKDHQLRLKATYTNDSNSIPVDIVVFKWTPKLDKLSLSLAIDGKELTTNSDFLIMISYNVIKRHIKLSGNVAGKSIDMTVASIKDFLEIPKLLGIQ